MLSTEEVKVARGREGRVSEGVGRYPAAIIDVVVEHLSYDEGDGEDSQEPGQSYLKYPDEESAVLDHQVTEVVVEVEHEEHSEAPHEVHSSGEVVSLPTRAVTPHRYGCSHAD